MDYSLPRFNEREKAISKKRKVSLLFKVYGFKLSRGFSLIELMVVIALFTITSIVVTTSYIAFEGRERVKNGALQLKSDLRYAQSRAQTGDKVSDVASSSNSCSSTVATPGKLVGWYVILGQNATSYTIAGDCLTGTTEASFASKSVSLPSGVTISAITYNGSAKSNVVVLFKPLDYSVTSYDDQGAIPNTWPGNLPDFLDDVTGVLRVGSLSGASPDEIVVRVSSTDGIYDVHIAKSGEINEIKI